MSSVLAVGELSWRASGRLVMQREGHTTWEGTGDRVDNSVQGASCFFQRVCLMVFFWTNGLGH